MLISEATQILRDRGYHISPMPAHMPRSGYLWMSDEPNIESFNAYSEGDIITLAEALHGNHRCYYCTEQAEYRCPLCHRWLCWEDQRDWSPDCVGKHNAIMQTARNSDA